MQYRILVLILMGLVPVSFAGSSEKAGRSPCSHRLPESQAQTSQQQAGSVAPSEDDYKEEYRPSRLRALEAAREADSEPTQAFRPRHNSPYFGARAR